MILLEESAIKRRISMFLALLHYQKPFDEVQTHVVYHREYLDTQYQAGKMIVSGPRADKTGGFILFATNDRTEVEAIIAADPYHTLGLATYEIIEFNPAKHDLRFAELYL
jgi:uncharacterized protein YciI